MTNIWINEMQTDEKKVSHIPPHREVILPGVHAYADEKSVAAGDRIRFHVSSDVPYTLSICKPNRIGDEGSDTVLHTFPLTSPRVQPIHPGSYISVENGLSQRQLFEAVTFEVWVKPWSFGRRQALLSQYDFPGACGYGLFLNEAGDVEFYVGNGKDFAETSVLKGPSLDQREWQHVVGTWDGHTASLWINAKKVASREVAVNLRPGSAPLRFGSSSIDGVANEFLDGDLVMPVIYSRILPEMEIARRFEERGLHIASDRFVLGCWPLREQRGDAVHDVSGHQRTGRIINHATWMINGPAFEPQKVGIYEETVPAYDPLQDPTRGNGIRFARDDLYDCRWDVTHEFLVPTDAKPGIYVGRVRFEATDAVRTYDITFIVKKGHHAAPAPMLVLCSTNTWLAYASSPFAENAPMNSTWPRRGVGLKNSHSDAPDYNTYTRHSGGQPAYHVGLRMPWPNAAPSALYDPDGIGFGQWTRLELYLHFWLDRCGYEYDVISELDLHSDPDILNQYKTVVINGHSEYWSIPAYDGVDRYLRNGGTTIVLSGNSIGSRVSFDENLTVMEQRKTNVETRIVPGSDAEFPGGAHGEQYHSDDWARGGHMRRAGRSSAHIIGLDTGGWAFAEGKDFGVYEVQTPDHFLFREPTAIDLRPGQTFGHGVDGALPRAIGHEWDLTFRTLKKMTLRVPDGQALPADHENIQVIAHGVRKDAGTMDAYLDFFNKETPSLDGLSCEMIYWERPEGGRVFNAGAVGANWVLGSDPVFEQLLCNVLHHFGIPSPGHNPSDR
jgi:N,N-dimethylformamidase